MKKIALSLLALGLLGISASCLADNASIPVTLTIGTRAELTLTATPQVLSLSAPRAWVGAANDRTTYATNGAPFTLASNSTVGVLLTFAETVTQDILDAGVPESMINLGNNTAATTGTWVFAPGITVSSTDSRVMPSIDTAPDSTDPINIIPADFASHTLTANEKWYRNVTEDGKIGLGMKYVVPSVVGQPLQGKIYYNAVWRNDAPVSNWSNLKAGVYEGDIRVTVESL